MVELIDKWEVVSKLITLQNNYNFFKNEWDAERLYREIAKLEINIGKTPGFEVVRCKDCKHWKPGESMMGNSLDDMQRVGRCEYVRFRRLENDFCSYGERKDNAK